MEDIIPPSREKLHKLGKTAGAFVPRMYYCNRCRSEAVGMPGNIHRVNPSKIS